MIHISERSLSLVCIMQRLLIPLLIPLYGCTSDSKDSAEGTSMQQHTTARSAWAKQHLQKMTDVVEKTAVFQQLNSIEDDVLEIEKQLLASWEKEWENKSTQTYQKALQNNGLDWLAQRQIQRTNDGISEYQWEPTQAQDNASEYLAQFDSISDIQPPSMVFSFSCRTIQSKILLSVEKPMRPSP